MWTNKKGRPQGADQITHLNDSTDLAGSQITKECRFDAWLQCAPQKRCKVILEALGDKEMTAREIATALNFSDLNAVKPRLTEMHQAGRVEVVGKKKDEVTDRWTSIYKAVE